MSRSMIRRYYCKYSPSCARHLSLHHDPGLHPAALHEATVYTGKDAGNTPCSMAAGQSHTCLPVQDTHNVTPLLHASMPIRLPSNRVRSSHLQCSDDPHDQLPFSIGKVGQKICLVHPTKGLLRLPRLYIDPASSSLGRGHRFT